MRGRIDATPGDAEGAYIAILQRLEKLIGQDFVRAVIGLIAVSRGGLRESDLQGAFKMLDLALNAADFSWLRQMLRGHLAQGDMQQWDFSHQSFRRAFYKEYKQEASHYSRVLAFLFINPKPQKTSSPSARLCTSFTTPAS